MTPIKNCLQCGQALRGRLDKKFCDDHCRSNFNNLRNSDVTSTMRNINYLLRKNRRILAELATRNGQCNIPIDRLQQRGFDFRYHTHSILCEQGKLYKTCYDYAYTLLDEKLVSICLINTKSNVRDTIHPKYKTKFKTEDKDILRSV